MNEQIAFPPLAEDKKEDYTITPIPFHYKPDSKRDSYCT